MKVTVLWFPGMECYCKNTLTANGRFIELDFPVCVAKRSDGVDSYWYTDVLAHIGDTESDNYLQARYKRVVGGFVYIDILWRTQPVVLGEIVEGLSVPSA
jgi:hypothetical protein